MKIDFKNGNGLLVSPLVLGGGAFCEWEKKDEYFRLIDHYLVNGGNCIDTARVYCSWLPDGDGISERIIGDYMASRGNRDNLLISTKGGHPPLSDMRVSRLSQRDLSYDLDMSLKTMKTDHADIYFLHRDDPDADLFELMKTLDGFVKSGKVIALGASNFTVKRITEANRIASDNGLTPFSVSQIGWSLAETTPEKQGDRTLVFMNDTEYKGYLETKIPVMAYSSQAKGFFVKKRDDASGKLKAYDSPENLRKKQEVIQAAAKRGVSPAIVALEYITGNRVDASAIVGFSKFEQLVQLGTEVIGT